MMMNTLPKPCVLVWLPVIFFSLSSLFLLSETSETTSSFVALLAWGTSSFFLNIFLLVCGDVDGDALLQGPGLGHDDRLLSGSCQPVSSVKSCLNNSIFSNSSNLSKLSNFSKFVFSSSNSKNFGDQVQVCSHF